MTVNQKSSNPDIIYEIWMEKSGAWRAYNTKTHWNFSSGSSPSHAMECLISAEIKDKRIAFGRWIK